MVVPLTKTKLTELIDLLTEEHAAQIGSLAKASGARHGLSKKQIEDMKVGFADGLQSMAMALVEREFLEVVER
jgi:hypothetical protein